MSWENFWYAVMSILSLGREREFFPLFQDNQREPCVELDYMYPLESENTGTASNSNLGTSKRESWGQWLALHGSRRGCHGKSLSFKFDMCQMWTLKGEAEWVILRERPRSFPGWWRHPNWRKIDQKPGIKSSLQITTAEAIAWIKGTVVRVMRSGLYKIRTHTHTHTHTHPNERLNLGHLPKQELPENLRDWFRVSSRVGRTNWESNWKLAIMKNNNSHYYLATQHSGHSV